MSVTHQIAQHLHQVAFGGNWTWSNLKDNLSDITWQQAAKQVYGLNTIAVLVFHIDYYFRAHITVLEGGPLDAHDKFSFGCPPIESQEAWEQLTQQALSNAEKLSGLIEKLSDSDLDTIFVKEKYGTYHRNFLGVIEHTHYHLGQVAILKKIVQQ